MSAFVTPGKVTGGTSWEGLTSGERLFISLLYMKPLASTDADNDGTGTSAHYPGIIAIYGNPRNWLGNFSNLVESNKIFNTDNALDVTDIASITYRATIHQYNSSKYTWYWIPSVGQAYPDPSWTSSSVNYYHGLYAMNGSSYVLNYMSINEVVQGTYSTHTVSFSSITSLTELYLSCSASAASGGGSTLFWALQSFTTTDGKTHSLSNLNY